MIGRRLAALLALIVSGCVGPGERAEENTASAAPAPMPTGGTVTRPLTTPLRADFTVAGAFEQGGWMRGQVPSGTVSARLGDTALVLDPSGQFFAAFDRDAGPSAMLIATLADGRQVTRRITVAPRAWNIEHINTARTPGGASAAFMERRRPELDAIAAARAISSQTDGWRQSFIWPATGRISGRFGSQRIYRGEPGSYHSGLDIATGKSSSPYVAPADGVVVLATQSDFSLEGKLLIIDHGQGLNSAFLHSSRLYVKQGDRVRQGQHIGDIGMSGRATGPHLHWSLKWRDTRLDPLLFLGPMP